MGVIRKISSLTELNEGSDHNDLESVCDDILKEVSSIQAPSGFGGFGAKYDKDNHEIYITHDTPRDVSDPKEYYDMDNLDPKVKTKLDEWESFRSTLFSTMNDLTSKFQKDGIGVELVGDVSAKGLILHKNHKLSH